MHRDEKKRLLLIDEVDVFFSKDFHGQTYNPAIYFDHEAISEIQQYMWQERHSAELLQKIIKLPTYKKLLHDSAGLATLFESHIQQMITDLGKYSSHRYEIIDGKIAYLSSENAMSTRVTHGYETLFAYFNEVENAKIEPETLKSKMGLNIQCGKFSYAEMPLTYKRIVGVTGTLESMSSVERKVIEVDFRIKRHTITPSIYGDKQLTFRREDDVHVVEDRAEHHRKILDEIMMKLQKGTAVLVYFESTEHIDQFIREGYGEKIEDLSVVTLNTENIDHYLIRSTRRGAVTLFSKDLGRGLDFKCHDQRVNEAGGVHVLQTFLSEQKTEENQIMGRTARQDRKGTYSMVLLAQDLEKFDITLIEVKGMQERAGMYVFLDQKRNSWFDNSVSKRAATIVAAKGIHTLSMGYHQTLIKYCHEKDLGEMNPMLAQAKVVSALLNFGSSTVSASSSKDVLFVVDVSAHATRRC